MARRWMVGLGLAAALIGGALVVPEVAAAALPPLPVDHITAQAWGMGEDGEFGDGVSANSSVPINYAGLTSGVHHIANGGLHTLVVLADGSVWSSGYNGYGELGDGTYNERLSAVPVVGLSNVIQVAAGSDFSLALRVDGTVWAWGANFRGQLGDGTGVDRLTPVPVAGLTNVVQIAAGRGETALALRADGTVWAWGDNVLGQIGDGTTVRRFSPVPVTGVSGVQQIATYGFTSLVLRTDGTVWGWGDNSEGSLGDGTTTDRRTPIQIPGLAGVRQVSIAGHSTAVMADGTVRGWGFNDRGQLGNGTLSGDQLTPVVLPGLTGIVKTALGAYHGLALAADGSVRAWGWNAHGILGDGTTTTRPSPVPVPLLTGVTDVGAGDFSSVAIVTRPYFSLAVTPSSRGTHAGGAVTASVRMTPLNGFAGTAALTTGPLPAGVTATLSPNRLTPAAPTSSLTLRTSLGTPPGRYLITIRATSPDSVEPVRTVTFGLIVSAPPADFGLSLSEPFGFAYAGNSDSTLVQVNPVNGFAETVSVSAGTKNLPTGLSVSLSGPTASASAPVTMTVSTTWDTPQGTYLITVSARADDPLVFLSHSTTYQITVGPPTG